MKTLTAKVTRLEERSENRDKFMGALMDEVRKNTALTMEIRNSLWVDPDTSRALKVTGKFGVKLLAILAGIVASVTALYHFITGTGNG